VFPSLFSLCFPTSLSFSLLSHPLLDIHYIPTLTLPISYINSHARTHMHTYTYNLSPQSRWGAQTTKCIVDERENMKGGKGRRLRCFLPFLSLSPLLLLLFPLFLPSSLFFFYLFHYGGGGGTCIHAR
jgi:hypothetical protein